MSQRPFRLISLAPPQAEPLSLDDARQHLRLDTTQDDELLRALIRTARTLCEAYTGRALIQQGFGLYLDEWPKGAVILPRPPLAAVTKINVYDANDAAAVLDSTLYFADTAAQPGCVALRETASRPTPGRSINGIEIQYTAGYGVNAQAVPAPLVTGIKLLLAALYENRGDRAEDAMKASGCLALFQPYRVMGIL